MGGTAIEVGAGPLLENLARFSAGAPFFVILVLNELQTSLATATETRAISEKKQWWQSFAGQFAFVKDIQFRPNTDFDIGAYEHALQILRQQGFDGDVLFMNSSLRGPSADNWLARYDSLFHERDDMGLCGITLNALAVRLRHGYAMRCAAFPDFIYRLGDTWQVPLVYGWRSVPQLAGKIANTIL